MTRVDDAERPDVEGTGNRAVSGADRDAAAALGSAELTIEGLQGEIDDLNAEVDDLQGELNDVRMLLGELALPVNPAMSLRRQFRQVLLDLRADAAAARRERDEHRRAADELRAELDLTSLARADAEALVERWIMDHGRVVERFEALKYSAETAASELAAIRERLREARVDGTQYADVSTAECVQQLVNARDGAVENWNRCHQRHLNLEVGSSE